MLYNVSVCPTLDIFIKLGYFTINMANVGRRTARTEPDILGCPTRGKTGKFFLTSLTRMQWGRLKGEVELSDFQQTQHLFGPFSIALGNFLFKKTNHHLSWLCRNGCI